MTWTWEQTAFVVCFLILAAFIALQFKYPGWYKFWNRDDDEDD